MQISAQTLENTYPTCNYVNCLWLFIQLFTLVFAHAFICHISGWQWCPESDRLSLQALWTDNGRREASWTPAPPAQLTVPYGERALWRGLCGPPHQCAARSARTCLSTCTHHWPHKHTYVTWALFCFLGHTHIFMENDLGDSVIKNNNQK